MKAEIISIGTELLLGHIIDTNSAYISRKLSSVGIDVHHHSTVGDNPARLAAAIRQALGRADIVMTSGGLGPTVDDITAEALSKVTGPEGAMAIDNARGTAPGLIARHEEKIIICLPGPPRELKPMMDERVIPYLKKLSGKWLIETRTIKTTGLAEAQVNRLVKDILNLKPPATVGIYAKLGEVDLKIMVKAASAAGADKKIRAIERIIRARLKDHIFGYDDETLEDSVARLLTKKKMTIGIAESCTGGLLADRLTDIDGSSRYFLASAVTYSNASKEAVLKVPEGYLARFGAVSGEVARAMARGAMSLARADIGIGITGIAGPTGGTASKPVGLVYISLATRKGADTKRTVFRGSRREVKFQATQVALDMLRRKLL